MIPNYDEIPVLYLKPGELHFSRSREIVSTVLGSCVSITLFEPRRQIGAICHALLPSGDSSEGFKYVDCCMHHMIGQFKKAGIGCWELEAKLFGGADMFKTQGRNSKVRTVGAQNIETALHLIEKTGLKLANSDIGGFHGRKIFFYTHTGEVLLKRVRKQEMAE